LYAKFVELAKKSIHIPPDIESEFRSRLLKVSLEKFAQIMPYLPIIKNMLFIETKVSCPIAVKRQVAIEFYGIEVIRCYGEA